MTSPAVQLDLFQTEAHLTRIEPAKNMFRFYALQIASDLFGGYALTRSWGRIGRSCTIRVELYQDEVSAVEALADRLKAKRARGYR